MFNRNESKTKLDKEIRKFIVDTRLKFNKTGTQISDAIGRTQTWITQVETGRIKNINNDDLISLFKNILDCDDESAIKYIEENQPTTNPFEENIPMYNDNDISDKLKNEYKENVDNITEGFNIFLDRVPNKQYALNVSSQFTHNMHADLGFMMALVSENWCKLAKLDFETKKSILKDITKIIDEKGTACPYSDDEHKH
jgi:transcriptional regulator with XRE-family HTH domain